MFAQLALLAAGVVAVHLDVADNIDGERASIFTASLAQAISERTGERAVADTRYGECNEQAIGELRSRLGARTVVCVQLIAAVTTVGVFTYIYGRSEAVRDDLENDPNVWKRAMKKVAERLFPPQQLSKPASITKRAPPSSQTSNQHLLPAERAPRETPLAPVILLGGAAVLGIASGALFLSANASRTSVEESLQARDVDGRYSGISYADTVEEYDSINTRRNLSLGLLIASGLAAVGAGVWWSVDAQQERLVLSASAERAELTWTARW